MTRNGEAEKWRISAIGRLNCLYCHYPAVVISHGLAPVILSLKRQPPESQWSSFYDPYLLLKRLGLDARSSPVAEFGCGYGTFTLAAARLTSDLISALDIDPEMVAETSRKVNSAGLRNVEVTCCDFIEARGSGIPDSTAGYAMVINILHAERPLILLAEVHRVLRGGGKVGVIHWNYDSATPRGPSLEIRPTRSQCRGWLGQAGFSIVVSEVDLPPYHYGILAQKPVGHTRGDVQTNSGRRDSNRPE